MNCNILTLRANFSCSVLEEGSGAKRRQLNTKWLFGGRGVPAMRTVREEGTFPPRGRCGKKRRFRQKDGTAERDVSARRTVRQKEAFPPQDGTKRKVAFPPRGWCGEKRNVSTTRMVRRREARFHHKDGTKKKDSSQQTIICYVC